MLSAIFWLNVPGGKEQPETGEDRQMPPSPRVATYDLAPEMSAGDVTERFVAAIRDGHRIGRASPRSAVGSAFRSRGGPPRRRATRRVAARARRARAGARARAMTGWRRTCACAYIGPHVHVHVQVQ